MSIASDLRAYADTAVTQSKQIVGTTLSTAQTQLNDVTGQAGELYGKARENVAGLAGKAGAAVNDLRTQAEKAVNLDALKTAVEPYVAQAKGYTAQVTDRAEAFYGTVKGDPRVAKLVGTAGAVAGTVQARIVLPVQSLTGRGATASKPAATATKAGTTGTTAATAAKPAAAKPAAPKAAATKPATTKPATKATSKPAAPKAPAKRAQD
jgi:hypothetical protein